MNQPGLLELAKQGEPQAIATLINHQLQPRGIFAKANATKGCLQIIFEAEKVPSQAVIANYIYTAMNKLKAPSIKKVIIYGKQIGNDFPVWQQELDFLNTQSFNDKQPKSLSGEVTKSSLYKNTNVFECHGDSLAIQTDGLLIKKLGKFLSTHTRFVRNINLGKEKW
ncbi:MAG: hypothetical protein KME55_31645 [Nostoc indistinguendum CM1-VF10]|jgi:hypothetical protein|nr:hypothetical protein [Nostoc indistinguendum CM1-VF10]